MRFPPGTLATVCWDVLYLYTVEDAMDRTDSIDLGSLNRGDVVLVLGSWESPYDVKVLPEHLQRVKVLTPRGVGGAWAMALTSAETPRGEDEAQSSSRSDDVSTPLSDGSVSR